MASFVRVCTPKFCMHFSSKQAVCPAHLILLDLITRIIFGDKHKSESSSQCNFLPSSVASSALNPNIFLSTLLSNTVSLCPSLNTRYQVSQPHRKTGEIIAMCFYPLFLDIKRDGVQTTLKRIAASTPVTPAALHFFMHAILPR